MIFAQANILPTVPWSTTASVTLGLLALILIIGSLLWVWNQFQEARDRYSGKKNLISPQPLAVEITKQLHEQFADKLMFEQHTRHNTQRHAQLFSEIDRVEREVREALEERFTALNEERSKTLEKLNNQFTFIRENLAAINRELQIRHTK